MVHATRYESPCGTLLLGERDGKVCLCEWLGTSDPALRRIAARLKDGLEEAETPLLKRFAEELDEYFAGRRREFDLPLQLVGTDFQQRVWAELQRIPYGQVISYKEEARRIGRPTATRAVANANHANPVAILVPCHRVNGADGSLTGYGGGLPAKRFLQELESGEFKFLSF